MKTLKGGTTPYHYSKLNFLYKLYYNFMCIFNDTYCIESLERKKYWTYNANNHSVTKKHTYNANIKKLNGNINGKPNPTISRKKNTRINKGNGRNTIRNILIGSSPNSGQK